MEELIFYFVVLVSIIVVHKIFLSKKHNYPPGPRPLPIIGNLHSMKSPPYFYYERVAKKLGPVLLFWMGKVPFVVISSPEAFREIFTRNDVLFLNRPPSMSGEHLTYNYTFMVWAPHGPVWKSLRRLTFTEIFSLKALQKSAYIRETEVRHTIGRLFRMSSGGNKVRVDMKHVFGLLSCNVVMRVTAGKRFVPEVEEDTKEEKRLHDQFKVLFSPVLSMNICDFIPVLRWVGYKGIEKSMITLFKDREVFLNRLMSDVRAKRDDEILGQDDKQSVINKLLTLQETDPLFYTNDIVKGIVLMMFIAGTETSTSILEWALTLLMQNPEKMRKLQEEIDAVVGDGRFLSETDFGNLPYLGAVVKETLRLYPPVPLLLPRFTTDETTIQGYEIPKGTTLLVNVWSMHRDPKLWENPEEFVPERFLNSDLDGHLFVPFGAGRRACPGSGMGTHIVTLGLGMIFQCFNWDKISMDKDMMTHAISVASLARKKPLIATFAPRQQMINLLNGI